MPTQDTHTGTADPAYKSLYKLGGVAAIIVAVLTLVEVVIFTFYPQPGTISGWFMLFQSNRLIGLMDFWGLEVPMYVMFTLVFLALYAALRKIDEGILLIALTFALLGIGIFFATNNPFSMLSLSNQYAAVVTDAERSTLQAAGQAVLANTNQRAVGGFNMGPFPGVRCGIDDLSGHAAEQFLQQADRLCWNCDICTFAGRLSQRSSHVIGNHRPSYNSSECTVPGDMVCFNWPKPPPVGAPRMRPRLGFDAS